MNWESTEAPDVERIDAGRRGLDSVEMNRALDKFSRACEKIEAAISDSNPPQDWAAEFVMAVESLVTRLFGTESSSRRSAHEVQDLLSETKISLSQVRDLVSLKNKVLEESSVDGSVSEETALRVRNQTAQYSLSQNSLGENSLGENSLGENSLGENSLGENSLGENSLGENSLGENSLGENSLGENSLGENSLGENSLGENSLGENSLGENSLGENSLGENSLGENSLGENSLGEREDPAALTERD